MQTTKFYIMNGLKDMMVTLNIELLVIDQHTYHRPLTLYIALLLLLPRAAQSSFYLPVRKEYVKNSISTFGANAERRLLMDTKAPPNMTTARVEKR